MPAALTGARIIDTAQGPCGRAAIALARESSFEGTESRILIDPSTGDPLGLRKVLVTARDGMPSGTVTTTITVGKPGWIDTAPHVPEGCTSGDADKCVHRRSRAALRRLVPQGAADQPGEQDDARQGGDQGGGALEQGQARHLQEVQGLLVGAERGA